MSACSCLLQTVCTGKKGKPEIVQHMKKSGFHGLISHIQHAMNHLHFRHHQTCAQMPLCCLSSSMLGGGGNPIGSLPWTEMMVVLACVFEQEADESLNFEEQILEAAKSIAAATSALVKAASAAQRELVAQGKVRAPLTQLYTQLSAVDIMALYFCT